MAPAGLRREKRERALFSVAPMPPAALGIMLAERTPHLPYRAEVLAARRGDRSAFETLVRSVQRPVFGLCLRLLRVEAEASEVAQETFLRAYQNLHRYDEGKPFDLWVMAIALQPLSRPPSATRADAHRQRG